MNNDEFTKMLNALEEYKALKTASERINLRYTNMRSDLQELIESLKSAKLDYTTLQGVLDLIEEDYAVMQEHLDEILKAKAKINYNPKEIKAAILRARLNAAKMEAAQNSSSFLDGYEEEVEARRSGRTYNKGREYQMSYKIDKPNINKTGMKK